MSEEFFLWWYEKIETLYIVVDKKSDTSEKNDEEIALNLVIVNKSPVFTGLVAMPFVGMPIKWGF